MNRLTTLLQMLKQRWQLVLAAIMALVVVIFGLLVLFNGNSQSLLQEQNISVTPTSSYSDTDPNSVRLLKTVPKGNERRADYTGRITLDFASPVKIEQLSLNIVPSLSGKIVQNSPTSISFLPQRELKTNTAYTIQVSVAGKTILAPNNNRYDKYSWGFKTDNPTGEEAFTPQEVLSFEKSRAAADKAYQERKAKFPFITSLPYTSLHFKVEINSSNNIIVTTYGATSTQTQAYQQEARQWLQSHGGNLQSLQITYTP